MSRLVRLYPGAWRNRYEDEFLSLLDERPPTARDIVDIVRGAIDAHLSSLAAEEPAPWTHRIPGALALTGGAVWSAAILYIATRSEHAWEAMGLLPIALLFMFLSLPGDYMFAHGRRIAVVLALEGASVVGVNAPVWAVVLVSAAAGYLIALGGMLTLAAIRAGVGARGRWLALVAAVLVPVAISLPAAVGVMGIREGEFWYVAILLPYGLSWILVGLRMAVRGAPTIVDPPVNPIEPGVLSA